MTDNNEAFTPVSGEAIDSTPPKAQVKQVGSVTVQQTIERVTKQWGQGYPELGEELRP